MKATYTVFRATLQKTPMSATLEDGSTVMADVPTLEVELVPDDKAHGTLVVRMAGNDLIEAHTLFVVASKIDATFTVGA